MFAAFPTPVILPRTVYDARRALNAPADTRRQIEPFPIALLCPEYVGSFRGGLELVARRAKAPDEIVVEMEGLALFRRNAVNVDSGQKRFVSPVKLYSGLFLCFTGRYRVEGRIDLFDMASRQQPALEPVVVDHEDTRFARMEYEGGAGDVPGPELPAGKRFRSVLHEESYEVFALGRKPVVARIEVRDYTRYFFSG